jgi:hypothetical protein
MNLDLWLNTLYRLLVGYSRFLIKGSDAYRVQNIKPSEIQRNNDRAYQTLSPLSSLK